MMKSREWVFGSHRLRFEEPDVLIADFHGPTRLAEVEVMVPIVKELAKAQRYFFLCNIADSSIDRAARKYVSESLSQEFLLGVAYVGAGALQRAMAKAIILALYYTGSQSVDVVFAATEAEARAFFARKRLEFAAAAPTA